MLVRLAQLSNAPSPIVVRLPGSVTLARLVQAANAKPPIFGDGIGNRGIRQAGAIIEGEVPDAGDAAGDYDVGQAGAENKCLVPDGCNRQAVDRALDGHRAAGAGVSGDGDGAVVGRVIVWHPQRGWTTGERGNPIP